MNKITALTLLAALSLTAPAFAQEMHHDNVQIQQDKAAIHQDKQELATDRGQRNAAVMAAMPLAVQRAASAPSISAMRCSSISTVGF